MIVRRFDCDPGVGGWRSQAINSRDPLVMVVIGRLDAVGQHWGSHRAGRCFHHQRFTSAQLTPVTEYHSIHAYLGCRYCGGGAGNKKRGWLGVGGGGDSEGYHHVPVLFTCTEAPD